VFGRDNEQEQMVELALKLPQGDAAL
jgi:hypothetical protein